MNLARPNDSGCQRQHHNRAARPSGPLRTPNTPCQRLSPALVPRIFSPTLLARAKYSCLRCKDRPSGVSAGSNYFASFAARAIQGFDRQSFRQSGHCQPPFRKSFLLLLAFRCFGSGSILPHLFVRTGCFIVATPPLLFDPFPINAVCNDITHDSIGEETDQRNGWTAGLKWRMNARSRFCAVKDNNRN